MSRGKYQPVPLVFVLLAMTLLILLLAPVWASGPDVEQETAVNIKGDTSRAIGLSGGSIDVDINQCLGSTSWGLLTFHKQKLVPNPWCEAESLARMGFVDASVLAFCTRTSVGGLYVDLEDCRKGMVLVVTEQTEQANELRTTEDDDDDHRQEQETFMVEFERRMEAVESARIVAAKRAAASRQAEQRVADSRGEEDAARRARARIAKEEAMKGLE